MDQSLDLDLQFDDVDDDGFFEPMNRRHPGFCTLLCGTGCGCSQPCSDE